MTIDAKYLGLTANQLAKIASDLKAEKRKLRRELDFYKAQVEPVDEDNRRLRERWKEALSENAKLREALESVLKCAGEIKRDSGCDTCPMYNGLDGSFADGSWCRLRPELRNLGFEEI